MEKRRRSSVGQCFQNPSYLWKAKSEEVWPRAAVGVKVPPSDKAAARIPRFGARQLRVECADPVVEDGERS